MMMSDFNEDVAECNDPDVRTLEDMAEKYMLDEAHRAVFNAMFNGPFRQIFEAHPSMDEADDTPCTGGGGTALKAQMATWFDRWIEVASDLKSYQLAWSVCYAVAEGNLRMLQILHKEYKADLTLGFCWGITLLDFASGKGHMRTIEYLVENDAVGGVIDKPSFRERITAIDRACKCGMLDVVDRLLEYGANVNTVRLNRQTPGHGAAIQGHTHILKRLAELKIDLEHQYDADGKSPLDYAVYFCHKDASEFLRSLQGGSLTRWEQHRLLVAATKMQALRRGVSCRKEALALRAMRKEGGGSALRSGEAPMALP